ALLNSLADSIGTVRILMMVNYRPEYHHHWSNKSYYTQLRLDPLGSETAHELLDALLGDVDELKPLKETVAHRTEGNPFFIEEMIQVLFDEGVLGRNGKVTIRKPLSSIRIPPTVKGILAARIDRLPAPEKELLQTLAVVGKEFQLGLIRHVVAKPEEQLRPMLSDLQLGEFIYEQPALPDLEYTFKHALTQEVAYDSVLVERRKSIHERAAAGIETIFADRLEDHVGGLAYHYSRRGNRDKALDYLQRAAEQANDRSAYEDAVRYFSTAIAQLSLLPDDINRARKEMTLQIAYGQALTTIRGFASHELDEIADRVRVLMQRVGDAPEVVRVLASLWTLEHSRGHFKVARELAERWLALAEKSGVEEAIANAHAAAGATAVWRADFVAARNHYEHALAIYDSDLERYLPAPQAAVIPGRCQYSWALWALGYSEQARRQVAQAQ